MNKAKQAGDIERYKELVLKRRTMPSVNTYDDGFRRLYYIRYADDFLLGFAGPNSETIEIKEKIRQYHASTILMMSEEKTLITHLMRGRARFLGYSSRVRRNDTKVVEGPRKRRSVNNSIQLNVPRDVALEWQNRYTKDGKPRHRAELLKLKIMK